MVIAPAKTGRLKRRSKAVRPTAQTKRVKRSRVIPSLRILIIVVIKFTAPKIEEIPAKCKEKILRSTEAPAWATPEDKGG